MPRRTLLIVLTLAVIWIPLAYVFYPAGYWVGHFELAVNASSDEPLESIRCRAVEDRGVGELIVRQAEAGALPREFAAGWTEMTDPRDRGLVVPVCVYGQLSMSGRGLTRHQPGCSPSSASWRTGGRSAQ